MARITKPPRTKRRYDTTTRRERQKIYNTDRWQRLRASQLADYPTCELCAQHDVITPAEDVHHKVSFMSTDDKYKRNRLAYDRDNLQSLCRVCHNYQHNQLPSDATPWGKPKE